MGIFALFPRHIKSVSKYTVTSNSSDSLDSNSTVSSSSSSSSSSSDSEVTSSSSGSLFPSKSSFVSERISCLSTIDEHGRFCSGEILRAEFCRKAEMQIRSLYFDENFYAICHCRRCDVTAKINKKNQIHISAAASTPVLRDSLTDEQDKASSSAVNSDNEVLELDSETNEETIDSEEGGSASNEDDYAHIDLADLKTTSTLGVGGFGRVNLVKHVHTDEVFALKILNKAHIREMNQQEHVLNERNILISCRTDFIVRLYKTYRDAERLYMLLEYCPGGEVWTMLHKWGRFDENTTRFYCAAALEAFDYLHRRFIIYRDLKPENMLLDANGIPKLVDFGFAKRLKSDADRTWTFCGTAEYVSPEIILNKGQDIAVDIWSLGIFMFELISGTPPFASTDPMHTYNSILRGVQMLVWPRYMSDAAKSLIGKFCRRDPTQRLGYGRIEDARKDAWFAGFDFYAFQNHTMRPPIIPKIRSPSDTQNFDCYPSTDNFLCGVDESGWDDTF